MFRFLNSVQVEDNDSNDDEEEVVEEVEELHEPILVLECEDENVHLESELSIPFFVSHPRTSENKKKSNRDFLTHLYVPSSLDPNLPETFHTINNRFQVKNSHNYEVLDLINNNPHLIAKLPRYCELKNKRVNVEGLLRIADQKSVIDTIHNVPVKNPAKSEISKKMENNDEKYNLDTSKSGIPVDCNIINTYTPNSLKKNRPCKVLSVDKELTNENDFVIMCIFYIACVVISVFHLLGTLFEFLITFVVKLVITHLKNIKRGFEIIIKILLSTVRFLKTRTKEDLVICEEIGITKERMEENINMVKKCNAIVEPPTQGVVSSPPPLHLLNHVPQPTFASHLPKQRSMFKRLFTRTHRPKSTVKSSLRASIMKRFRWKRKVKNPVEELGGKSVEKKRKRHWFNIHKKQQVGDVQSVKKKVVMNGKGNYIREGCSS
jgi:hypothetical protein